MYKIFIAFSIFYFLDSSDIGADKVHSTKPELLAVKNYQNVPKCKKNSNNYYQNHYLNKYFQNNRNQSKNQNNEDCSDSQDYDEGLGDSEIGDTASSNGCHSNQAIHSDQSEDSSLTDSERTLVGEELSPRNNSPDIMGSEMDQDLEPLHAGIEVLKPECDAMLGTSEASCPVHRLEESRNMSSPEENTKDSQCSTSECCKNLCTCAKGQIVPEPPPKRHFRAYVYFDYETGEKSMHFFYIHIFLCFS